MTAQSIETAATEATAPQHGAELIVPLNRLKASPKNARKTPHNAATIEAFAASIRAKGVLQPPVVEVERDGEGVPTGNYLVTIGEGRRQGLRLLAKRKAIKRTHPVRVPERAGDLWGVVAGLAPSEQLDLMACCAGVGLYAVRDPHDRRPGALAQAETLAAAVGLDMTGTWSATTASYFARVSKARVLEAVTEAVNAVEAGRIAGFKKGDMAEAAERLVEGKGWLPPVLRTVSDAAEPEDESAYEPRDDDAYAFAAE